MQERTSLRILFSILMLIMLVVTSCSSEPSKTNLGAIGHLKVSRHIDTAYTYGLKVEAGGVLGATRYYLYYSKTDNPSNATIIVDKGTNALSTSLNRYTTSGTYYFWYRASNGTDNTDFSNSVSLSF